MVAEGSFQSLRGLRFEAPESGCSTWEHPGIRDPADAARDDPCPQFMRASSQWSSIPEMRPQTSSFDLDSARASWPVRSGDEQATPLEERRTWRGRGVPSETRRPLLDERGYRCRRRRHPADLPARALRALPWVALWRRGTGGASKEGALPARPRDFAASLARISSSSARLR